MRFSRLPPYSSLRRLERRDEGRHQIAMRHVQLDHVEAGALGHFGSGDELVADQVHVLAVIALGSGCRTTRPHRTPTSAASSLP
jgi:hypothetical protein